jgi:hypothetical protein
MLETFEIYRNLESNRICIKLEDDNEFNLEDKIFSEIHIPSQIKVKKIKIKIEEVE